MGELSEMLQDGTLCEQCGIFIGNDFPSHCSDCWPDAPSKAEKYKKVKCTQCNKMLYPAGVKQHMVAKHS